MNDGLRMGSYKGYTTYLSCLADSFIRRGNTHRLLSGNLCAELKEKPLGGTVLRYGGTWGFSSGLWRSKLGMLLVINKFAGYESRPATVILLIRRY